MSDLSQWLNNLAPEQRAETLALNDETESSIKLSHLERAWPVLLKRNLPEQVDYLLKGMVGQFKFDNTGRQWLFDFAWPEHKIAVELHGIYNKGGAHGSVGRHLRPAGFSEDRNKMNAAQVQGWIVLEFTPINLEGNLPFATLLQAFEARGARWVNP